MAINSDSIPTYLNELRSLKVNGMIRDIQKLKTDELLKVQKEIDKLLSYEAKNA